MPLNLPGKTNGDDVKKLETRILLDRPSEIEVGDKLYRKKVNTRKGKKSDMLLQDISSNMVFEDRKETSTSVNRRSISPYPIRDNIEHIQQNELWWTNTGSSLSGEFSFITLPYFPFFSNCDGYDSHIGISRLFEEHPDCSLIEWNNTKAVNQYPWADALSPLSDTCQKPIIGSRRSSKDKEKTIKELFKGIDISCLYEEDIESPSSSSR